MGPMPDHKRDNDFFSSWFRELKELANHEGLPDIIGMYWFHVGSYKGGLTPGQEFKRLKRNMAEFLGYHCP